MKRFLISYWQISEVRGGGCTGNWAKCDIQPSSSGITDSIYLEEASMIQLTQYFFQSPATTTREGTCNDSMSHL